MAFIRNVDKLIEGLENKFFTEARARAAVAPDIAVEQSRAGCAGVLPRTPTVRHRPDPRGADPPREVVQEASGNPGIGPGARQAGRRA